MSRHNSARPRVRGFTFAELLVVVSLAVVLGSVVLPSLNTASDQMKAAVCVGNMHQWGMALMMYADDWNDVFPHEGTLGTTINAGFNLQAWYNVLPRYINQPRLVDLYAAGKPPTSLTKGVWSCPSATNTTIGPPSSAKPIFMYAFNARMDPNNGSPCPPNTVDIGGGDCRFRRSQMTSPANTIIFAEAENSENSVGATTTVARHFGGGHFALGDGHAEWIKFDDYCRACPTNPCVESDSTVFCDWKSGIKYHWFPFKGAST